MTDFSAPGFVSSIDERLRSLRLDRAARVAAAQAEEQSAENVGEARRLAERLGSPVAQVLADIEHARRVVEQRRVSAPSFDRDFPVLAGKLDGDFEFLSMSRDDLGNLTTTESTFGWLGRSFDNSVDNLMRSIGTSIARVGGGNYVESPAQRQVRLERAQVAAQRDDENWGADAVNVLTSLGATVAGGAAGFAVGGPPGAAAGAFSVSYAMASGEVYNDLLDLGYTPNQAGGIADSYGLVMASLDLVGAGRAASAFSDVGKKLIPQLFRRGVPLETKKRVLLSAVKDYAADIGVESVTEVLQQATSIAARYEAHKRYGGEFDVDIGAELWDTLVHTARGMSIIGLGGAAGRIRRDYKQAANAQQTAKVHEEGERLEAESKLAARSPEARAEFVTSVAPEDMKTAYIRPGKLIETIEKLEQSQEGAREQLETSFPGIMDRAKQALEDGTDVELPIGDWQTKLAQSEIGRALMPHTVFHQDADTAAEREELAPLEDQFEGVAAEAAEQAQNDELFRDTLQQVYQTAYEQVRDAGRPSSEAAAAASFVRNMAVVLARHEGIPLHEFVARESFVAVQRELTPQQEDVDLDAVFAQDESTFTGDDEAFPTPTAETKPGTIVRSEEFPHARGVFIGVSPAGSMWVAWRKNLGVAGKEPETMEEWATRANQLRETLAYHRARAVSRGDLGGRDRLNQDRLTDEQVDDPAVPVPEETQRPFSFYSALRRELAQLPDKVLPPVGWRDQINSLITKGRVKREEVELSGILDWLETQPGKVPLSSLRKAFERKPVEVATPLADRIDEAETEGLLDERWDVVDAHGNFHDHYDSEEEAQQVADELNAEIIDNELTKDDDTRESETPHFRVLIRFRTVEDAQRWIEETGEGRVNDDLGGYGGRPYVVQTTDDFDFVDDEYGADNVESDLNENYEDFLKQFDGVVEVDEFYPDEDVYTVTSFGEEFIFYDERERDDKYDELRDRAWEQVYEVGYYVSEDEEHNERARELLDSRGEARALGQNETAEFAPRLTKFGSYVVEGQSSQYEEHVIVLDDGDVSVRFDADQIGHGMTSQERDQNRVLHIRTTRRLNDKGEPVFFVEELQSDWAQRGGKSGFMVPKSERHAEIERLRSEEAAVQAQIAEIQRGAPNAAQEINRAAATLGATPETMQLLQWGEMEWGQIETNDPEFVNRMENEFVANVANLEGNRDAFLKYVWERRDAAMLAARSVDTAVSVADLIEKRDLLIEQQNAARQGYRRDVAAKLADLRRRRHNAESPKEASYLTDEILEIGDVTVEAAPIVSTRQFAVVIDGDEVRDKQGKKRFGSEADAKAYIKKAKAKDAQIVDLGAQANTKAWVTLGLKRIMLLAAEQGYNNVAFATGQQNADHWSLYAVVDKIRYIGPSETHPRDPAIYDVRQFRIDLKDGKGETVLWVNRFGRVRTAEGQNAHVIRGKPLAAVVGQENADLMLAMKPGSEMPGADLVLGGGRGLETLYGRTIPNTAKPLLKKFKTKMDVVRIPAMNRYSRREVGFDAAVQALEDGADHVRVTFKDGQTSLIPSSDELRQVTENAKQDRTRTRRIAQTHPSARVAITEGAKVYLEVEGRVLGTFQGAEDVEGLDRTIQGLQTYDYRLFVIGEDRIPPNPVTKFEVEQGYMEQLGFTLSDEALEELRGGLPLFQEGEEEGRGAFYPGINRILLKKDQDSSTVFHELSHYYLEELTRIAGKTGPDSSAARELNIVLEWAGDNPDTWFNKTTEARRKTHEAFALSFERWLYEGVAPNEELRGVFSRIRAWLVGVYTDVIQKLNRAFRERFKEDLPGLTDEVRGVFGRMVASEAEVRAAFEASEFEALFQSEEEFVAAGGTAEGYADLMRKHQRAEDEAVDELTRRRLRQMELASSAQQGQLARLQRRHNVRRREIRREVEAQRRLVQVERLRTWLRNGEHLDADGALVSTIGQNTSHKLNRAIVTSKLDTAAVRKLSAQNVLTNTGLPPDVVAPMFDYASGEELIDALLTEPEFGDAVRREIDDRMRREHPELTDPKIIREQIAEAIHNKVRKQIVVQELKLLEKNEQPVRLMRRAAKNAASKRLQQMDVKDVTVGKFAIAARRARRETAKAVREGDLAAARAGKRRELMAEMMAEVAAEFRAEKAKAETTFRKAFRKDKKLQATRDINVIHVLRSVLATLDAGRKQSNPDAHLKQVSEYAPEVVEEWTRRLNRVRQMLTDKGLQIPRDGRPRYEFLTVDEFREFAAIAEHLWTASRRVRELTLDDKRMLREEAVEQAKADLGVALEEKDVRGLTSDVKMRKRATGRIKDYFANLTRVEHLFRGLGGIFPKLFVRVKEAANAKRKELRTVATEIESELRGLDLGPNGTIHSKELNYTFGEVVKAKAEILGMALHFYSHGADSRGLSNRDKLLDGYGWDAAAVEAFLLRMQETGVLTRADFQWIQRVYDRNASYLKRVQRAHYAAYGYYMKELKTDSFETTFGTFRGGYVPAHPDPNKSSRTASFDQDKLAAMHSTMPVYERGFTMERVANVADNLLDFNIGKQITHVESVLNFIHMHPAVRDVNMVLGNQEVRTLMNRDLGHKFVANVIDPWLKRSAEQTLGPPPESAATKFVVWMARGAQMGTMFLNVVNSLQNYTGFGPILRETKAAFVGRAAMRYMSGPRQMGRDAAALSPEMAERMERQVFEITQESNEVLLGDGFSTRVRRAGRKIQRNTYVLQTVTQHTVDVIGWWAKHDEMLASQLAEGADPETAEKVAVREADSLIRRTQMSGAPEDISSFEGGGGLWKAIAPFKSWFINWLNYTGSRARADMKQEGVDRVASLLATYATAVLLPGVVATLIADSLRGDFEDEDGDGWLDDSANLALRAHVDLFTGPLPIVGDGARILANTFLDDRVWNTRMPSPPYARLIEKLARAPSQLAEEVSTVSVFDAISALGMALHVPLEAFGKRIRFLNRLEPDAGPGEVIRGLLGGR